MITTLTDCARIYLFENPYSTRKEVHEFCQSQGVANNAIDKLKNVSGILSELKTRGEADFQKIQGENRWFLTEFGKQVAEGKKNLS
jgi:hypothetical protein